MDRSFLSARSVADAFDRTGPLCAPTGEAPGAVIRISAPPSIALNGCV
jgi:hypothetical protein